MLETTRRVWLLGPLVLVLFCIGAISPVPAADYDIPPNVDKFDDDAKKDGEDGKSDDPFFDNRKGLDADTVNEAIEKGVRWLQSKQGSNGSWGEVRGNRTYGGADSGQGGNTYGHPAGVTALSLLALLKCGVPKDQKSIKDGFDFLERNHRIPGGSYERSVLLLALIATGETRGAAAKSTKGHVKVTGKYRRWAQDVLSALIEKRVAQGWRYQIRGASAPATGGPQDMNSTQFAVLALLEAHRAGMRIQRRLCEDIIEFTLSQQEADGKAVAYPLGGKKVRNAKARGFAYILGNENPDEGEPTGAVTAGGIANLQIVRYILTDEMSEKGLKRWNDRKDVEQIQQAIYDGLAWMHVNWDAQKNPRKKSNNIYHLYWLYATERAMDLFGLQLLGLRRWYPEMGSPLVQKQHGDGHWDSDSTHEPGDVLDTGFALLFLCRSTKHAIPGAQVTPGEANPQDNR